MSGYHLMKMRIDRGLSQKMLSKEIGLSRSQLSRIENDLLEVDEYTKKKMCEVFEVLPSELEYEIKKPRPQLTKLDKDTLENIDSQLRLSERMEELRLSIIDDFDAKSEDQQERIEELEELNLKYKEEIEKLRSAVKHQEDVQTDFIGKHDEERIRSNARKRSVILISFIAVVLIASITVGIILDYAGRRSFKKTGSYPADITEDDYGDFRPVNGRIYCDYSYYKTENGRSYIASNHVGKRSGEDDDIKDDRGEGFVMSDEEVKGLKEGDSLKLDRDITITIGKVYYYPNWKDSGIKTTGEFVEKYPEAYLDRPDGLISIGNNYYFVHPKITWDKDNEELESEFYAKPDEWVLYHAPSFSYVMTGYGDPYLVHDMCFWHLVDNECEVLIIRFDSDGEKEVQDMFSVFDLPEKLLKYRKTGQTIVEGYFEYTGNKIVYITVYMDEDNAIFENQ